MPGGRPLKLNPEDREIIVRMIESGRPKRFAAQAVGITERTLYNYLRRGSDDLAAGKRRTSMAEFFQAVKKAESIAVGDLLDKLNAAAHDRRDSAWQAFAWQLERMYPSTFGLASARRIVEEAWESGDSPLDALASAIQSLRDADPEDDREDGS